MLERYFAGGLGTLVYRKLNFGFHAATAPLLLISNRPLILSFTRHNAQNKSKFKRAQFASPYTTRAISYNTRLEIF